MFLLLASTLVFTLFALIGGAAWLMYYILIIHPQQENNCLALFSVFAVSDVISRYPRLNDEQRRGRAEQRLRDILNEKGLTLVGDAAISTAIGWAMEKKHQEEVKLDLEKLKAEIKHTGIDKMITSVKLPIVKHRKQKPLAAPSTPKLLPSGEFIL